MSTRATFNRDLKALTQELLKFTDAKTIGTEFKKTKGAEEVINAILKSAKSGIGPGNKQYPDYSPAYQKLIDKHGGQKDCLRGIGKTGRAGGMLDPGNFEWIVESDGRWYLEWNGPIYGPVHQGTKHGIGGTGHTKNPNYPARPWLHFANPSNASALMTSVNQTLENMVAEFNAGHPL